MEYHSFQWYSIGESHVITGTNIFFGFRLRGGGTIGTSGTNRQIVYARPSGVNVCSLQNEHRSAASFSIGAIGTNGSIARGFLDDWYLLVNIGHV